MTLLDRIAARRCAFHDCTNDRLEDGALCSDHMRMLWRNELDREADGTYVARRRLPPRDMTWSRAA